MSALDCGGLIELTEQEVTARLGKPGVRRVLNEDLWLVFESPELRLRVRCVPAGGDVEPRIASWTASFRVGHETLAGAARAVGLWPVVAPDESADQVIDPLLRRPVPCPVRNTVYSFTASVRRGLFTGVSLFDEEPDWL